MHTGNNKCSILTTVKDQQYVYTECLITELFPIINKQTSNNKCSIWTYVTRCEVTVHKQFKHVKLI